MEQVIDTNIWVKACRVEEFDFNCSRALMKFYESGDMLALDEECIMSEYNHYLRTLPFFQKWILQLRQEQRMTYHSSHLAAKFDKKLYELGFQEKEDHIFVGVAMNSDKHILTEDSDYGVHGESEYADVHDYMKNEMGLTVQSVEQYLSF